MAGRVLILRPEPGAARTAAAARALGLQADSYPLFSIVPLPWTGPEPHLVDALMFTSANGARHAGPQLARYAHLPAYAVGAATAAAMDRTGLAATYVGSDGVQSLLRHIATRGHGRVLHISGRDIRPFDPGPLRVTSVCVYAAVDSGSADALAALLAPGTVALIHSPRAGHRLAELVPMAKRPAVHLVAISAAALEAAGLGWASADAPAVPDDQAMLALAAALCD